jgi:hypothetical protein
MNGKNSDSRSAWQIKNEAREDAWLGEYSRYEADREFRRARLRAIVRLLRGVFPGRSVSADRTKDGLMIPIDSIVGLIDASGREVSRLPPLRRSLADAWRRGFTREDADEAYPILEVRAGPWGWYVKSDAASLLFLEIMRAKAMRLLRVRQLPGPVMRLSHEAADPCSACENELDKSMCLY